MALSLPQLFLLTGTRRRPPRSTGHNALRANSETEGIGHSSSNDAYNWSWPAIIATIQNTDEIASLTTESSAHANAPEVHASTDDSTPRAVEGMWWLPTQNACYGGAANSVLATAGIEDETIGYSATPALVELRSGGNQTAHSVVLNAPGVMLGKPDPAMLFPVDTYFTPYSVLHNSSSNPLTIRLSLTSDQSGAPVTRTLDSIALQPGQTMQLDYSRYFNQSDPLPNGFGELSVSYTGEEGDLLFEAGSADQTQNYVFGVTTTVQANSASKTICYWSIEGDNDSMISIWNWSTAPEDLDLTLYFHGGHYRIPLHLASRKAYNLDLMDLVRSQAADPDGNLIPSNVTNGSALLSKPGNEMATISVAVSTATYNVRNATCGVNCGTCNGVITLFVEPDIYVIPASSQQAIAQATLNTGSTQDMSASASWTTGSIATVNSTGLVTGVSPGTSSTSAELNNAYTGAGYICEGTSFSCPTGFFPNTTPTTVQVPSQLLVSNDVTATVNCPYTSLGRTITYTMEDQTGSPMTSAIQIHENVSPVTSSCNNQAVKTGTGCVLNSEYQPGNTAQFNDLLFAGCPSSSSVIPCGFTFPNQQWQYCLGGQVTGTMGTIGTDNVGNAIISVDGNTTILTGTTFKP